MSSPRYPKHKDSEVEWLGKVPDGWVVIPVPPKAEQAEIMGFLDVEIAKLDTLTTEAQAPSICSKSDAQRSYPPP